MAEPEGFTLSAKLPLRRAFRTVAVEEGKQEEQPDRVAIRVMGLKPLTRI